MFFSKKMDLLLETSLPIYEKCGEILTSYNTEERLYTLNCLFCKEEFLALLDFIKHIEELHITTTKKEKDLLESPSASKCIDSISVEPKEEYVDVYFDESQVSLDPLMNTKIIISEEKVNEDDLLQNENQDKDNLPQNFEMDAEIKTDSESSDVDYKGTNNREASEDSESNDDGKPSNNFLDGVLDANKDVTLSLIEGLEKLPTLWQKSSPQYGNRKNRAEALQNLAKDLNKRFGKRMKRTGIDERIRLLRKRFRNELIKEKIAATKGQIFEPSWYFSKLDFLRNTIQIDENTLEYIEKPAKIFEVPFNDEQLMQFIKIYESIPCLWNIEDVTFKSRIKQTKAIKQMLQIVEEKMQLQLTEEELQRKIKRLKAACTKEKHELLNCERLGTTHVPTFKHFSSLSFLIDHVYPLKCPYCTEIFKGCNSFQKHKAQHSGLSPYICSICNKTLASSVSLSIHMQRHNQDYRFECKPCSRKFTTPEEFNIHMRHHTGEKPYFCEVCGKSFATGSLFGRHKRRHEKRPTHQCTICNIGFYEQIRYKEHMNIHNDVRDRICDVCGKGFTHLKYLKHHKLLHTGRRDYVCTICGKDFVQSAGLYCHMKTHGAKISDKVETEEKGKKKNAAKQNKSSKTN